MKELNKGRIYTRMNNYLREILSSRGLVFLLFIFIASSLIWNTIQVIQRNFELQKDVDKLEEEISLLELENTNLKLGIDYYNTDSFLELEARKKFNRVASGEKVLLLEKNNDEIKAQEKAKLEKQEEERAQYQQNLDAWLDFFFGGSRDVDS